MPLVPVLQATTRLPAFGQWSKLRFGSRDGRTPLMNACAAGHGHGHGECVRVLLKAGADPLKDVRVPDVRRGQKGLHSGHNG